MFGSVYEFDKMRFFEVSFESDFPVFYLKVDPEFQFEF